MAKRRINLTPTEHFEQVEVFAWAEKKKHEPGFSFLEMLYAIPNGEARPTSKKYDLRTGKFHTFSRTGFKLKMEGVKSGVPDICLPVARGGYFGLYIEMKRIKGSCRSDNQEKWFENLRAKNYFVKICYGHEEAIQVIESYCAYFPTQVKRYGM